MAVNCGYSFGLCAVRVTIVDPETGLVTDIPNNSYVSDKGVTLSLTPNIETGNTFSLRNGCGCSLARFKSPDVFNWFEFSFARGALEPQLEQMLLGGTTIEDGADVVGINGPGALACDQDQPSVALEFWTQHNLGSGQDTLHPWVHWVFPYTLWQLGDNTAEEDIMQLTVNGFSRTSGGWGSGPYGDGPPDGEDITEWAYWKTATDPPTAACLAADVEPGS